MPKLSLRKSGAEFDKGARGTNWRELNDAPEEDAAHLRNVHEEQQLKRSRREETKSLKPAQITSTIIGVFAFIAAWFVGAGVSLLMGMATAQYNTFQYNGSKPSYVATQLDIKPAGGKPDCFMQVDAKKKPLSQTCYKSADKVPVPAWYTQWLKDHPAPKPYTQTYWGSFLTPDAIRAFGCLLTAMVLGGSIYSRWSRNVIKQNVAVSTEDINQHHNDQHIALPEELMTRYEWVPDYGAHFSPSPSTIISHVFIDNAGINKIKATVFDKTGEPQYNDDGSLKTELVPMFDKKFAEKLYASANIPPKFQVYYDTRKIAYNPDDRDRDKLKGYRSVADMINGDWEFPDYEVQRPAGAYLIDTAPVNTMVIAMTRAGKGQTFINPSLDVWTREKRPNNVLANDPKGELLRELVVPATRRGYEVIQFNLINTMKTDGYNPLGLPIEAARDGDFTKCALYVENVADVFFPVSGGEDPVWPNAASNAFRRAVYGLIEWALEEERKLRRIGRKTNMPLDVLETKVDSLWGKVTLYNAYQFFVQLSSQKRKDPVADLNARKKAGQFDDNEDEYNRLLEEANRIQFLWEGRDESSALSLYFAAIAALPKNGIRELVSNTDNVLKSMADSEKMLASVYGITLTAMSFFANPTISALTSCTPNQNVDLAGFSFPRRLGVRFHPDYLSKHHLAGATVRWSAYSDDAFTQDLGSLFEHRDTVNLNGWAWDYFDGKFPTDQAWIKLELFDSSSNMLMRTFYFKFNKGYQQSFSGKRYIRNPITGDRIIKNGTLQEVSLIFDQDGNPIGSAPYDTVYPSTRLSNVASGDISQISKDNYDALAFSATRVRYSESPKMTFFVTPPHLMSYAKLILILLKQIVDLNFDQSYMTKDTQKPLYKCRFMLDELGKSSLQNPAYL